MAQALALLGRVVSEVTAMHGPEWDPKWIRAQILGSRARGTMGNRECGRSAGVFEDYSDDEIIDGPGA
jgi:hypothetical protein